MDAVIFLGKGHIYYLRVWDFEYLLTLSLKSIAYTDEAVFVGVEGPKTPAPPLAANITGAFGYAACSLCQYN